jgi:hypothetical protein
MDGMHVNRVWEPLVDSYNSRESGQSGRLVRLESRKK